MIQVPKKIAICFTGGDTQRTQEQINMLAGLEEDYDIEWSLRSDKTSEIYYSFSQIINEAVIETSSEFMVFVNPSAIISTKDIKLMINDLCRGFAFSSVISFGLWATTKELFRKIGMMDERFIGGGYEDNDFLIRLKQADLAIFWRYRTEKYPHWAFGTADKPILKTQYTGLTDSIYGMKWFKKDNTLYRTNLFLQEKKAPKWFLKRENTIISNSWKSWMYTKYEECYFIDNIFKSIDYLDISNNIAKAVKTRTQAKLTISLENGIVVFRHTGKEKYKTNLVIVITDAESRQIINHVSIKTNNWWGHYLRPSGIFELENFYDIRVLHGGRILIHDNFFTPGEYRDYKFGLDIYDFLIQ